MGSKVRIFLGGTRRDFQKNVFVSHSSFCAVVQLILSYGKIFHIWQLLVRYVEKKVLTYGKYLIEAIFLIMTDILP